MMESESTALPLGYTPVYLCHLHQTTLLLYHISRGLSTKIYRKIERKISLIYFGKKISFTIENCMI